MNDLIILGIGFLMFSVALLFIACRVENAYKERELSIEALDQKYEYTLTIKIKNEDKKDFKVFSNWKYESDDILNFFINKEMKSIEYKKNGSSILIPMYEIESYEFNVRERSE